MGHQKGNVKAGLQQELLSQSAGLVGPCAKHSVISPLAVTLQITSGLVF